MNDLSACTTISILSKHKMHRCLAFCRWPNFACRGGFPVSMSLFPCSPILYTFPLVLPICLIFFSLCLTLSLFFCLFPSSFYLSFSHSQCNFISFHVLFYCLALWIALTDFSPFSSSGYLILTSWFALDGPALFPFASHQLACLYSLISSCITPNSPCFLSLPLFRLSKLNRNLGKQTYL